MIKLVKLIIYEMDFISVRIGGVKIKVNRSLVPKGSELLMYEKYEGVMDVSGGLKDVRLATFRDCIKFLETGRLSNGNDRQEDTVTLLDRLGCLSYEFTKYYDISDVTPAYMKVIQEEVWHYKYSGKRPHDLHTILTKTMFDNLDMLHLRHIGTLSVTNLKNRTLAMPRVIDGIRTRYIEYAPDISNAENKCWIPWYS
jgi:hypothetical protein